MRVIVVGGGPGGYAAAIRCAQRGSEVSLIEDRDLGGTCLNRGCIPTKAMAEAARIRRDAARAAEFGVQVGEARVDFAALAARRQRVVSGLVAGLGQVVAGNGIRVLRGRARLIGGLALEVAGPEAGRYEADAIVLAPGSVPGRLRLPGVELPGVVNSDELLAQESQPASLCIVGGGVIGCEFASIYAALGSRVSVVELLPRLLPPADEEVARRLASAFRRQGIEVAVGVAVEGIRPADGGLEVHWSAGSAVAETVLVAVGRRPNTDDLGCEAAGVARVHGAIVVGEDLATTAPGIWAVGDAIGAPMLAHAAFAEADVAAARIHGEAAVWGDRLVPNPVFTHPEVAWVGLSEQEAKRQGIAVTVARFPFAALGRAQIAGDADGFYKVVAAADGGRLLGVHAIGPSATELVSAGGVAAQAGLRLVDVAHTVFGHPTLSEGFGEAAEMALGRPLHALRRG